MNCLLVFDVDHIIDIITNSSSELFVLEGETKEAVEALVRETCPGLSGDPFVRSLAELDMNDLTTYLPHVAPELDLPNMYDSDVSPTLYLEKMTAAIEKIKKCKKFFVVFSNEDGDNGYYALESIATSKAYF